MHRLFQAHTTSLIPSVTSASDCPDDIAVEIDDPRQLSLPLNVETAVILDITHCATSFGTVA